MQSSQNRISWLSGLVFILIRPCCTAGEYQEPAFVLGGTFEDVFADKHNTGGTFTVNAFESNALVDVTFENGFRQIVGTDGHDSFDYNANKEAEISFGRFPTYAHEFHQFLWLVYAHDPGFVETLHNYRFRFYGVYSTNDVTIKIVTNIAAPNLISSIKWYAPNYIGNATNRHELAMYPNGYLRAEIAVTKTQTNGDSVIPSEVEYKQYNTVPFDPSNSFTGVKTPNQLPLLPIRNRDDVVTVEFALFSMTNIQLTRPLSSYIPEIPDITTRVSDRRFPNMPLTKVLGSGQWWKAHEFYEARLAATKPRRKAVQVLFLTIFSIFPIFLLVRAWKRK